MYIDCYNCIYGYKPIIPISEDFIQPLSPLPRDICFQPSTAFSSTNPIFVPGNSCFNISAFLVGDTRTSATCKTIASDGFVYAAFYDGKLKGFVSVESEIFGGKQGYCDLSSIHISEDMRRKGIGRTLFLAAKEWAKQKGAKKLYISAHSAVESQAFYKSMGCVEAEVYNKKHVEDEPYDCQLECDL